MLHGDRDIRLSSTRPSNGSGGRLRCGAGAGACANAVGDRGVDGGADDSDVEG